MITSFEVGAVFKIINQASPELTKILRQVRSLTAAIDKAKLSLAELGKGTNLTPASLSLATKETEDLAAAWKAVAAEAKSARAAIGTASAAARLPAPPAAGGGRGGGGGRHQPGWLAGSGRSAHISGPGIAIPGGGHVRFGGAGIAAAGIVGYGAYQAAEMEDTVWQLIYHSGQENNEDNRAKFRKVLQDSMIESGYGIHDIGEAAKSEMRMFQGTPGNGIDVLPEMLRAATIESRLKGESPEESMKALIGLAHMTKEYDPESIKKLAGTFAALSTANPGSLGSIEKAAGYAVPFLQSAMGVDPKEALLLGTVLTRAGATSTKSGTWLREMMVRAMPGTTIFESLKKGEHHDELLRKLGLLDDKGKPTWFTDNKPDPLKMLDIASAHADQLSMTDRAGVERLLFGAQGGGGFALLTDPAVRDQIKNLDALMSSPEFRNKYQGFMSHYNDEVTAQGARTAMQEFNVTMGDLGKDVLPAVNGALKDFKSLLEGIRSVLPGAPDGKSVVGKRALETGIIGAAGGFMVGGPVGAAIGGIGGGIIGGVEGIAEQYIRGQEQKKSDKPEDVSKAQDATLLRAGALAGGVVTPSPITLNLNIDGQRLAQALSTSMAMMDGFPVMAPGFDGAGSFVSGDHNHPDN